MRGLAYTGRERHPALFMRMRLGKTLVAIRRILAYRPLGERLRVLVVAPTSALGDWRRELLLEGRRDVTLLLGTRKQRLALLAEGHEWYLFNKEGHRALPEVAGVNWDAVVIDESTFIKNPRAKVSKFYSNNFRDVPHRWILTGTPNPESDMDMFEQFRWLDGGNTFGARNFWQFRTKYCVQDTWNPYEYYIRPDVHKALKERIGKRAFILDRKDVGLDNERVYQRRVLTMPKELRKASDEAERNFVLEYDGKEVGKTIHKIVTYTWLRQMCGGFVDEKPVWDGKVAELRSLLEGELAREPVVVWFAYNQELRACLEALQKFKPLGVWGELAPETRFEIFRKFQTGERRVLLMQIKCGTYGVDLAAASTAIYFSSPLASIERRQTEDRIASVENKGPLLFIDLLAEDSVDEDIYEALKTKKLKALTTLEACKAIRRRRA